MAASMANVRRIGLIGPLLPYRGGISQHTTMLHRTLRSRCDLLTVSFRRQYPRVLYPGKGEIEDGYNAYCEPGVTYSLDSLNPFSWTQAVQKMARFAPVAVIIPWWTVFWAPCFGFIASTLKRRNIKIIFLCHNVLDHETAAWKALLTQWVLTKGTAFLVHTRADAAILRRIFPDAKATVSPHPVYDQFPDARGLLARRASLELLFFGFIRPYKGLDILINAMLLLNEEDIFLTIAGEWWQANAELRRRIEDSPIRDKVEVIDRYISEQETAELFSRADYVVLPYRTATGSGIIPLAYHYGKPVIASRVGGMPDVVEDAATGWLVSPENPDALAEVIRSILRRERAIAVDDIAKKALTMTWDGFADSMLSLLEIE